MQDASASRPAPGGGSLGSSSSLGPFGAAVVMVSAAFLVAGIALPQAAEALLRFFVVALAVGWVLTRAWGALFPVRPFHRAYAPFHDPDAGWERLSTPLPIRDLTMRLRAADDPEAASTAAIPAAVRATLVEEARRRLARNHDLDLDEPAHHPAVRSILSDSTWRLVRPERPDDDPAGEAGEEDSRHGRVPVARLAPILDDLEAL